MCGWVMCIIRPSRVYRANDVCQVRNGRAAGATRRGAGAAGDSEERDRATEELQERPLPAGDPSPETTAVIVPCCCCSLLLLCSEDKKNPQRTLREGVCGALVWGLHSPGERLTGWEADDLEWFDDKQAAVHSPDLVLGHHLRL